VKRSITIAGHRTSISLEPAFWAEIRRIAKADGTSLARLVASVDGARHGGLSSALRLLVLERLKGEAARTERG